MNRFLFLTTALLIATMLGCGDGKPPRYTVQGTVTFDGNPVAKGEILIAPFDGKGRPDAGRIIDGKYEFKVTPGDKKVEITAASTDPKLVGERPQVEGMNPGIDIPREYIPDRYNEETELRITIEEISVNEHPFDLVSEDE